MKNVIVTNLFNFGEKIILQSRFEFILHDKFDKRIIKKDLNFLKTGNRARLAGGEWLIVVKFYESKLSMMVKEDTKIEAVIQRIARWLAIDREFINLYGRLFPDDVKR
jgi:hypothetical protein